MKSKNNHFHPYHRQPKLCGSSLDFEFIRECLKINKIRPKFQFWTKIEIKMTYLVVVFYCLFASRAIWKPFYRRLRFWVVLTVRKAGDSEADRSSSKLHKSHKNGHRATHDDTRDALCPPLDRGKLWLWRKLWANVNYVTSKSPVTRIPRKKTLMEKV